MFTAETQKIQASEEKPAAEVNKLVILEGLIKHSYSALMEENSADSVQYLARLEISVLRELEMFKKEPVLDDTKAIRLYQNAVIVYQYMATFNQLYRFPLSFLILWRMA